MPSGGPRPNSGRPPTRKYLPQGALVLRALGGKITPLEVIINTMHFAYHEGLALRAKALEAKPGSKAQKALDAQSRTHTQFAVACARDAAPYVHSKYATITEQGAALPDGAPVFVLASAEELRGHVRGATYEVDKTQVHPAQDTRSE